MASLMNLFARTHGLIKIRPTVRVTDNYTLSLVYTPGVGHVCKVIEKDPDLLYDLCITGRSIALITDGSGYEHHDTDELIPNLEFESALYKLFYDLDAYPIILNSKKLDSVEKVISVIDNLSPVYKTQVFIGLSHQNAKYLEEAYKLRSASVIVSHSTTIDQHLSDAALAKALVDSRTLLTVAETNHILKEQFTFSGNILDQLVAAYSKYLHDIFKNNLEHKTRKGTDPEVLVNRLRDYFSYGDVINIKEWGQGHQIQNHDNNTNSVHLHNRYGGMIRIETHLQPKSLDLIYGLFGSAIKNNELDQLRKMIREDKSTLKKFTFKKYYAAIITNGTAILGLGDIGPSAGLPVMEGKSVLFNSLGGIDLMPICLKEKNVDKLVELIQIISPIFSSINLEDIKAPECFPVEQRCIESIPIPLMHDDQHGTAVVALAAIINGLKLLGKQPQEMKLVINGAGAAGVAIAKLLHGHGINDIIICDTEGPIYQGRPKNMNPFKDQLASFTNPNKIAGTLKDAVIGRDIFIGVSAPGALTGDMIRTMNKDPFILALANPVPEIMPEEAYEAGAFIVATGRSDFSNQVNNSLAFPGIFRGAIDCSARIINLEMKIAAAHAIADCIPVAELNRFKILPTALAVEIPAAVAKAVVLAAQQTGVAQHVIDAEVVFDRTKKHIIEGYIPKL